MKAVATSSHIVSAVPSSSPSSPSSSASGFLLLSPSCCCAAVPPPHPFLNLLSQRHYHHRWWAQPRPVAGLSWSRLALAPSDTGEASGSFSQKAPLQPPATKTLPRKPSTVSYAYSRQSSVGEDSKVTESPQLCKAEWNAESVLKELPRYNFSSHFRYQVMSNIWSVSVITIWNMKLNA